MAWTDIPASVYAVGKPITSVSYGYLKDNIEGHDHVAGRGAQIPQGGLKDYAAGSIQLIASDAIVTLGSETWTKKKEIVIIKGGILRISFDLKTDGGTTARGRIYRNGIAIGTERTTTSSSYVNFSEDISGCSPQDLIQLYIKTDISVIDVLAKDFKIKTSLYDVNTVLI